MATFSDFYPLTVGPFRRVAGASVLDYLRSGYHKGSIGPFEHAGRLFLVAMRRDLAAIVVYSTTDGVAWSESDSANRLSCHQNLYDEGAGDFQYPYPMVDAMYYSVQQDPDSREFLHVAYLKTDFTLAIATFTMTAAGGQWTANRTGGPNFDPTADPANMAPWRLGVVTGSNFYVAYPVDNFAPDEQIDLVGCTNGGAWSGVTTISGLFAEAHVVSLITGVGGRVHALTVVSDVVRNLYLARAMTIRPPTGGTVLDSPFLGTELEFATYPPSATPVAVHKFFGIPYGYDGSNSEILIPFQTYHFLSPTTAATETFIARGASVDNMALAIESVSPYVEGFHPPSTNPWARAQAAYGDGSDCCCAAMDSKSNPVMVWGVDTVGTEFDEYIYYSRYISGTWEARTTLHFFDDTWNGSTHTGRMFKGVSIGSLTKNFGLVLNFFSLAYRGTDTAMDDRLPPPPPDPSTDPPLTRTITAYLYSYGVPTPSASAYPQRRRPGWIGA